MSDILAAVESLGTQPLSTDLAHSALLGFDTETTGVSYRSDAIVSATLVLRDPVAGHAGDAIGEWVINPHRPISPGASAVNGFTTEYLEAHGAEPAAALTEIADVITAAQSRHIPLLAYNAPFDIAMLEADLGRWGLARLTERLAAQGLSGSTELGGPSSPAGPDRPDSPGPAKADLLVVDPLVIDRAVSHRPGKRTLTDTTFYYGVHPYGDFHDATADTIAAVDLIAPIATLYPQAGKIALGELMDWQRAAHQRWETSFGDYMRSKGRPFRTQGWL